MVEPGGNDEERAMGRDSDCVIVREAAVGVMVARLGSDRLILTPFSTVSWRERCRKQSCTGT